MNMVENNKRFYLEIIRPMDFKRKNWWIRKQTKQNKNKTRKKCNKEVYYNHNNA